MNQVVEETVAITEGRLSFQVAVHFDVIGEHGQRVFAALHQPFPGEFVLKRDLVHHRQRRNVAVVVLVFGSGSLQAEGARVWVLVLVRQERTHSVAPLVQ